MEPMASAPTLHVECQRDVLLAAIQAADAVVPSNSTKPILTNLMLEASADRLEVVATDLQVNLRCVVKRIDVKNQGVAVVQARQLNAILKESHSSSVQLAMQARGDAQVLGITLADGEYQVPAVVGEQFPTVAPFPTDVQMFTIPGKRFEEMLGQTAFAMDKDRTSAVLSGLLVTITNGEFVLAATDGKVLGEAVEQHDSFRPTTGDRIAVVLPAATVGHLQRILGSTQPESVEFAVSGKVACLRLRLAAGLMIEITSRLVDGTFPAYRNALNAPATPTVVRFKTAELASAVRRAALMTSNSSRGIVITIDTDRAVFSNLNYTTGSARIPVSCQYGGNPQRMGLDSRYLADVLRVYKSDDFAIELGRAMVMREAGATYLIMPIALPS
jgi:DNA polymerase-3 subunit beta